MTKSVETNAKPLLCNLNHETFTDINSLTSHKKQHVDTIMESVESNIKPLPCKFCHEVFTHKQQHKFTEELKFRDYINETSETDKKPDLFNWDSEIFNAQDSITFHNDLLYVCAHCRNMLENLNRHLEIQSIRTNPAQSEEVNKVREDYSGEKPCQCDQCGITFVNSAHLNTHHQCRSVERPYQCNQCGKTLGHTKSLIDHLIKHNLTGQLKTHDSLVSREEQHGFTEQIEFEKSITEMSEIGKKQDLCNLNCEVGLGSFTFHNNVTFNTDENLKHHLEIHSTTAADPDIKTKTVGSIHHGEENKLKCSKEERRNEHYTSFLPEQLVKRHIGRQYLEAHMTARYHNGKKLFQCDQCDKTFQEKRDLRHHLLMHIGVKLFQCDQCDKEFTQKGHLTVHLRTHTGEKPFHCGQCSKVFTLKHHLTGHLRTHKNHAQCNKSFILKDNLTGHVTAQKQYKCAQCDKAFISRFEMYCHFQAHIDDQAIETKTQSMY